MKALNLDSNIITHFSKYKRIIFLLFTILFIMLWVSDLSIIASDPKIVIILAANNGGGVLKWKSEQEWAIERISIENKRSYAKRHGYGSVSYTHLDVYKRQGVVRLYTI